VRRSIATTLGALLLVLVARAQGPALPTVGATIAGERFALEVARDAATMYRGLGGRMRIDPAGGMLFVYAQAQPLAFVMRDCPVPIDVAFLDAIGRVINLHEMRPEPPRRPDESQAAYEARLPQYRSALPARFAIEVAGGRLRALGIGPGDRVEIDWQGLGAPR
jgi:hypothetical protein